MEQMGQKKSKTDKRYLARCQKQLKEWGAPLSGWYCRAVIDVREDEYDAPLASCAWKGIL